MRRLIDKGIFGHNKIKMSCPWICCDCCYSCFKKRKSKYSYVRYSSSKSDRGSVNAPSSLTNPPISKTEILYEFAQDKCQYSTHPKMFLQEESCPTITEQPRQSFERRFNPQISTSSVGSDYSEYIATGKPSGKSKSLPRNISGLPSGGKVPDLRATVPKKKRVALKKQRSTDPGDYSFVPGLPILEEVTLNEESHPIIQFSMYYDIQHSTLTVHLHHASNLPAKDRRGTSDPFVVTYILPNREEIFESRVIYQTLNPVFDQSFEFKRLLPDDIRQQTLIMHIYDHDKFSKNDTIGGIVLPLESADLFGVVMRMRIEEKPEVFSKNSNGDLLLALSYDPNLFLLKGVLLKATNLKKQDVIGLADPYIKIRLFYNDKQIGKWKSTIKRNTLIPVYNESFQFDILEKDINEILMEILVMDYDRFSKDDIMGVIRLGSSVEGKSECKHWREMILTPRHSVSQWHSI